MALLHLPLANPCETPSRHNYLQVVDGTWGSPRRRQVFLGSVAIDDPVELLQRADQALADFSGEDPTSRRKYFAAAASIVRLCAKHDEPQIEPVSSVIAYTSEADLQYFVDGTNYETVREGTTEGWVGFSTIHSPHDRDVVQSMRRPENVAYMPSPDYSATLQDHRAVRSHRGADAASITFGLLGNEALVKVDLQPSSPEW